MSKDRDKASGRWVAGNQAAVHHGGRALFGGSGRLPAGCRAIRTSASILRRSLEDEWRQLNGNPDGPLPLLVRLGIDRAVKFHILGMLMAKWTAERAGQMSGADLLRAGWQQGNAISERDRAAREVMTGVFQPAREAADTLDPLAAILGRSGDRGSPTAAETPRDAACEVVAQAGEVPEPGEPANNEDNVGEPADAPGDAGHEPAPGEVAGSPWGWLASAEDAGDGLADR